MFNTNPWLSVSSANNMKSTYIQGFLDICGNIVLRNGGFRLSDGDLSMNGNLWIGNTISSIITDLSANRNLQVGLDASFNGNVSIKGIATFNNAIIQAQSNNLANMNIASSIGTYPNFEKMQGGSNDNNLSIGTNNFTLVNRDTSVRCIAIGRDNLKQSAPSGSVIAENIGIGRNNMPVMDTIYNSNNNAIGNSNAESLRGGYNNIFIGNGTCTGVTFMDNTTAVGTNAGRNSGYNCTYLGAYTSNAGPWTGSTAVGYKATITKNFQIRLGTANDSVDISGNLFISGNLLTTNYIKPMLIGFNYGRLANSANIIGNIPMVGNGWTNQLFDSGHLDTSTGVFTVPVKGIYFLSYSIYCPSNLAANWCRLEINVTSSIGDSGMVASSFLDTLSNNGTASSICVTCMKTLYKGDTVVATISSQLGTANAFIGVGSCAIVYLMFADLVYTSN